MLRIEKISKSFPQRGIVLDALDFNAERGESVAITGPSGCGKTTLLNIIGGLDKPDKGVVAFEGALITNYNPDELCNYRNRNIGFVFQDNLLLSHLTVKENIMLPLLAENISKSDYLEADKYCNVLMKRIGIAELSEKYPFQISGGEAQRTTLVRALIRKPTLLLADEPTGSLDAKNAETLSNLLIELNKEFGVTLILVTHSEALASKMEKLYRIEDGKLKQ
jgi:ABC-type lipoprotein export system ATPase subunit